MSSDPIHDVPVGIEPVLQDLSKTPRVDPLKRLIERYPPKPPPPRTKGKVDAKALISQLPAETLLWLQGPHREVNFRSPPPTNESTEAREARIACTRAWIRSLGANPDDKPIYTKHRLIPTEFVNPYAPKKKADDAGEAAAEPAAEPDAGEAAGEEAGAGEE